MSNRVKVDRNGNVISRRAWTIRDEAIHRGYNYAEEVSDEMAQAMREGMNFHAVIKQAFEDGFLHGFAHKFDEHNYEEQNGNTL
jgi:hypothetical protein